MIQLLRFILIGVLNTSLTFMVYYVLVFLKVNYLLANILAYSAGTINSYFWNRAWVFKCQKDHSELFYKFVIVNLITLLLNSSVLYVLVTFSLGKIVSQVAATFFGIWTNFLLNKIWTFKVKEVEG